jgi:hypothetical protein
MTVGGAMNLSSWIAEYEAYLHTSGYASRNISRRMKHLSCLEPFLAGLGLKSLEEFEPEQNARTELSEFPVRGDARLLGLSRPSWL